MKNIRYIYIIFVLLLGSTSITLGQITYTYANGDVLSSGQQEPVRMRISSSSGMNGYIYLPQAYDSSQSTRYPLICYYHGRGGNGYYTNAVTDQGLANVIAGGAAPYSCPKPGDTTWFIVYTVAGGIMGTLGSYAQIPIDYRFLLDYYRLKIDTARVYATGLSAGGNQTLVALAENPTEFAAGVPMSTVWSNLPNGDLNKLYASPAWIWQIHGYNDNTAIFSMAHSAIEDYNAARPDHQAFLATFAGGHCCWNTFYNPTWKWTSNNVHDIGLFNNMSIYDWMLQYRLGQPDSSAPQPPFASAGNNQTITLPVDSVLLDGSASDDSGGSIASYQWSQQSGPSFAAITNPDSVQTEVTGLDTGTYIFNLTVTDDSGATASATVTVTVKDSAVTKPANRPPIANAGSDQTITLPVDSVLLDGSASSDSDGTIASYQWVQQSGSSSVVIANTDSVRTEVTGLDTGTYIFTLTVTDDSGATSSANVAVTVQDSTVITPANKQPVANAGGNQTIALPMDSVLLDGSASVDSDGTVISYQWVQQSGPSSVVLANADSARTEVTGLDTGTYIFTLTVTDDSGAMASANVTIIVQDSVVTTPANKPPVANAGGNQTIALPMDSVLLDGSASVDSDGTVISYQWVQQSGPSSVVLANADSARTEVTGLDTGTYIFTLTVTDDSGAMASANVTIIVQDSVVTTPANKPPVANAGNNQTITLPVDSILLDGSASSDSDGTIASYEWVQQSGPSSVVLANADSARTEVTGLDTGTYIFTLTVTDDSGAMASANVTIIVQDSVVTTPANKPPIANAGGNQTITLPVDSVLLDGSASYDSGGAIASYQWTQQSGPAPCTLANADSVKTTVTLPVPGVYLFTLTVVDAAGNKDTSGIAITVKGTYSGPPVANAGKDTTFYYPQLNTIYLNGSNSYTDGGMLVKWEEISGPPVILQNTGNNLIRALDNLPCGIYMFKLTVMDYGHRSNSSEVTITVLPDPTPPGDISYSANTFVPPYNEPFQYGTNPGSFGNGWSDTSIADIALQAGVHSIRLPLPDYFVQHYGYNVRINEFNYYTHQLGMKELTLFVGQPSSQDADDSIYAPATSPSSVFANLYQSIWDNGQNGTPVNDSNYFAVYIYNLVKRYGKNIRFWEIVNEPDATGFWDNGNTGRPSVNWWLNPPSSDALLNLKAPIYYYIRMLRIAYEVVKRFYPDEYIAPGGIGFPAFLDALLRYTDNPDSGKITPEYPLTGGAYFDAVSFHCYPAYNLQVWDGTIPGFRWYRFSDRAANAIITMKNTFDSVLSTRGYNGIEYPQKPFIITETNLPSKAFDTYFGSDSAQFDFIIKALVKAQQNGIKQFYSYGIGDSEDPNTATGPYGLMGLYQNLTQDPPGTQKLTDEGKAYKTTSMLLYGWQYDSARTAALNLPSGVDGGAFRQDTSYRYVLWAKTNTDMSEAANATYSFPASLNMDSVYRYEWNYSVDPNANSQGSSQNIPLTGTPSFFTESKVVDSINRPPVADAGNNQTIMLPVNSVTLDGSASTDPDGNIVSYQWMKTAGPASYSIDTTDPVHPKITGLIAGAYTFTLTVTDNQGATSSDNVIITVNKQANQVPIANAGTNQTITLPVNTVNLDGSASFDPDGSIAQYQWTKKSGPSSFTFSSTQAAKTFVSDLAAGIYIFTLTVTDNSGAATSSDVTVIVNARPNKPPVANAGNNITIRLPVDSAILNGSASKDPDGTIADYQWDQESGSTNVTFGPPDGANVQVSGLVAGVYVFQLTVTDNDGATAHNKVTVTVQPAINEPPVADAGNDNTITLPQNSVGLNGSASFDPDGKIAAYQWSESSGPSSYHFNNANAVKTSVSNLTAGTYTFTLTVTDNKGATNSDNVIIVVRPAPNQPPVANAGGNQAITLPEDSLILDGSDSHDPDGNIVQWKWVKKSGPSAFSLSNDSSAKTIASGLVAGTYVFILTVTDNSGATASADVTITVNKKDTTGTSITPPANKPPVANAGSNQTIILPLDSVTLDGSASYDPDGKIVSWRWVKTSGPTSYDIKNSSDAKTAVTGLTAGTYTFTLTVTDDSGATASANVTITVNKNNDTTGSGGGATPVTPPANKPPVANAGGDQIITLPADSVVLDGSASYDPDGKIVSWRWVKTSGPTSYDIKNSSDAKTAVTGLTAGTYTFTLTVTDDSGATASANVTITVNKNNDTTGSGGGATPVTPPANKPPVANAGGNQIITLPVDSVVLDGSASYDPDGKVVSWKWVKTLGPVSYDLKDSSDAKTAITGLVAGTYIFTLTVTDDSGAAASADVIITVNKNNNGTTGGGTPVTPPTNKPPVANAGSNQTITLPLDSVTLDGSASYDPDGKIVSWRWVKTSGPTSYDIKDSSDAKTRVTGLAAGTYIFTLTVTDDSGATASANVTITVNKNNDATGSGGGTTQVTPPANKPPVANAGSNQTITLPVDSVVLDGSASYDPDGKIVSWKWIKASGPVSYNIKDSSDAKTAVTGLAAGTYTFTLTVIDDSGATASANVTITVNKNNDTTGSGGGTTPVTPPANKPPVANAGSDVNIFLPDDSTLLDGSASYDPDGKIVSWSWSQQSGPAAATILQPDSAKTEVSSLVNGVYVFTLIVTDNGGAKDTSNVTVGVYKKPDQPPVANAGQDITIVAPQSAVTLDGSASTDPDGTIVKYHWDPMTGQVQAKLLTPDAPTTIVSGLQVGTYGFKLTVTDNNGLSSTATVSVYVMPARDTTPTTFRIYPNPVHDELHVELDKAITGLLEFRIIDVSGRILKVYRFGQLPMHITKVLDVSGLTPGIYFIQLIEDNQLRDVKKMIKY